MLRMRECCILSPAACDCDQTTDVTTITTLIDHAEDYIMLSNIVIPWTKDCMTTSWLLMLLIMMQSSAQGIAMHPIRDHDVNSWLLKFKWGSVSHLGRSDTAMLRFIKRTPTFQIAVSHLDLNSLQWVRQWNINSVNHSVSEWVSQSVSQSIVHYSPLSTA